MTHRFCAFDLEISTPIPDGETDWKAHRPLGISCYALAWLGDDGQIVTAAYHGTGLWGLPTVQMEQDECVGIVERLQDFVSRGFTLLTHNGASFDFDILAEESGMVAECKELAMSSVDTCYLVHCLRGFPVGLDAIARGMRLQGKTEGVNGALAPQMWAEGEHVEVLEYVQQDARCTLQVALEIEQRRGLRWVARSGRLNALPVPELLTVREALELKEPDVSWMSNPIPRSRFTDWMNGRVGA